ncbi:MAG: UvrD-helicase domain-containing protein [Intrasporangium sp.]|uniref:UvrD-helicase domain-containing protein n=1 Tax=Intrasporangium sp. TaxID=1925024 RepID=UPI0026478B77|nr:UvrD-helicase domain-containing protein [Intrasporangium sp.]MDN5796057.1 UvrD-helicase domain-containing protein [Intrasporangium sp.]
MNEPMPSFDSTGALPSGTTLIEASAGTGKTWTLSTLAVRYVAERGLPLDELLVVTFSRAASRELRERVRARLGEALLMLEREDETTDVLVRHLRDCGADELDLRVGRLRTAVADFDTATIATIHQFCHYVLKSLGVAGDSDPYATLAEDLTELRDDVIDDRYLAEHAQPDAPPLGYDQARAAARIALDNPGAELSADQAGGMVATAQLDFVRQVRAEVSRRKRRAAVLSYDDLLSELARALATEHSPARRRMRDRWSVVLVDEFQDTDPVQWQVFSQAFDAKDKTLVLIGDPKQAIYGFRGGDVDTYLRASESATSRASLPTNYRSDAPLVASLRTLMAGVELSPGIVAHPVTAERTSHRLQGAPDNTAVRLRAVIGAKIPIGDARRIICADAADDIARLLTSDATFGGVPVKPQHVAVLAFANRDLHSMREALRNKSIPSVLVSSESVLRTTGASWWLQLLMALEQPHRPERVRLAALTPFLGWSVEELDAQGDRGTESIAAQVRSLLTAHHRGGIAAVLDVSRGAGLDARLLSRVGGERDLTDIGHCAQLLQERVLQGTTGLPSLVAWLRQQSLEDATAAPDARVMRLDSDALAVTLSTIHGSKGLQYPIVYAPFLFDNYLRDVSPPAVIHRDGRRVLSFDKTEVNRPEHRAEALGEHMRLSYVAMTRAQSQLVLWWAPTANTAASGLHRLLFGQADSPDQLSALLGARAEGGGPDETVVPGELRSVARPDLARQVLQVWASHGAFGLADVDGDGSTVAMAPEQSNQTLTVRRFDGAWVDQAWRRTSYTSLASAAVASGESTTEPEREALGRDDEEPITVAGDENAVAHDIPSPMASLPVGARFGSLAHAVLEEADLQAPDLHGELVSRVEEQLQWWPETLEPDELATALEAVSTTSLGPLTNGARLVDIPQTDRLAEMEFELPLAGGDHPHANARLRSMAAVLRRHLPADDPLRGYADALDGEELGGQALLGYLTGSVDLTFRHGGRYYVVDYKTNWLGEVGGELTLADYTPARLAAAMIHSSYPLQAILYSVVLHRYLRWRLPGYDPEQHLGGVMYLYLRGMAGAATPSVDGQPCGVFSWRPPAAMLEELSAVLDGRGTEGHDPKAHDTAARPEARPEQGGG